jgi:hypothetical protein
MTHSLFSKKWYQIGLVISSLSALSLGLAWLSPGFDLGSFLAMVVIGAVLMALAWRTLQREAIPGWVGRIMIVAAVLRLMLAVALFLMLPLWGHGTEVEKAGYVMSDASRRDTVAWTLSQSEEPLTTAFHEYRLADQYGGLLFISAAAYRFFGGEIHQPLMMVILTASFSAVAIPFTWAFTRRLWGGRVAKIGTLLLVLFPEAVLLGSSQMREGFMITLMSMAMFGLVCYWQDHHWKSLVWILIALGLSLPLSVLFAIMLLGVLLLFALVLFREKVFRNWVLWAVLGGLLLLGVAVVWISGERIYPEGASNPLSLIRQWLIFAGRWEKRVVSLSSGWFKKILNQSPEWMHIWLILGYGSVQPFLPAALIATGNWLWRLIALWRSIGWTLMLILLLHGPYYAFDKIKETLVPAMMTLLVWGGILLAAFRGGGDQWDNPRYRVVFMVLQVALVAWVIVRQRETHDPWLRRITVGLGFVFAWFIPWYLRRYSDTFTWPVIDLFKTIALGFITAFLYWLWDWARNQDKIAKPNQEC